MDQKEDMSFPIVPSSILKVDFVRISLPVIVDIDVIKIGHCSIDKSLSRAIDLSDNLLRPEIPRLQYHQDHILYDFLAL